MSISSGVVCSGLARPWLEELWLGAGVSLHLQTLLGYDGRGGCCEVWCEGDTADIYREEMREWAIRVNWDVSGGAVIRSSCT